MANPMPQVGTLSRGEVCRKVRQSITAVRAVCSLLKHHLNIDCGIVVSEIVEGGSLGYGTYVPMKFDIDLVIYSTSLSPDKLCDSAARHRLLVDLETCIATHLKGKYVKDKLTRNSVQFKYQFSPDNTVDVDILVSSMWDSPLHLSQYISSKCPDDFFHLSAGASKWQKKFMNCQTLRVKEYIKRAKYWSLTVNWEDIDGRKPTSYLISLLVIKATENFQMYMSGKLPQRFKKQLAKNITKAVKALVKNYEEIDVLFSSEYHFSIAPPSPPRIVDPANICNNLYKTGFGKLRDDEDYKKFWKIFADNIDTLDLSIAFEHRGFYSDVPQFGKAHHPTY